jgi:DNA invertase Pin-like site-specific DNA recombinase
MDLGAWLRSLGLGKYEAAFRENEIDETVLPSLTEEHQKQLGVTALGHRVKLLDAIDLLRADGSAKAPLAEAPSTHPRPAQDTAERRQVTVMFSDLVGSTALSARMDPEDLREVISAYQKCVAGTVERLGGFVAKYMGDGVLVYFGYPQAHEDDAEQAVRAGMELIQAVGRLKSSTPLQTRVGIATGLVAVGDLIGSGEAQERGIVGETPNLAQRRELHAVAERHGWNIVATYEDARVSGAKGRDERPGFDALMRAVARREIDLVAAWSVDRLGRSLTDLLGFLTDLHAKGVDLFLHQQGLDTSTPSGRAMYQMLGVFAEFERAMIRERVMTGLARARSEGKQLGRRTVEQSNAAKMKALKLRSRGLGIRRIASEVGLGVGTVIRLVGDKGNNALRERVLAAK